MIPPKEIKSSQISRFLHDAKRFILSYCSIADLSPLQLYSSALTFAPKKSIIRNIFQNYIPDWILQEPNTDLEWNAVLQTLEGHSNCVNSVAFSHDSKLLASASHDHTIKLWDAATGTLQQTLEGHSDWVNSVAFSHDSTRFYSFLECFWLGKSYIIVGCAHGRLFVLIGGCRATGIFRQGTQPQTSAAIHLVATDCIIILPRLL
jgi:WD40 repeat protein